MTPPKAVLAHACQRRKEQSECCEGGSTQVPTTQVPTYWEGTFTGRRLIGRGLYIAFLPTSRPPPTIHVFAAISSWAPTATVQWRLKKTLHSGGWTTLNPQLPHPILAPPPGQSLVQHLDHVLVDGEQPREERAKEENAYKETEEQKFKSQRRVSNTWSHFRGRFSQILTSALMLQVQLTVIHR